MLRRFRLPLLLALLAGGGFYAWRQIPPTIVLVPATNGPAVEAVYATGSVEPVQWARVGPATPGRIIAVLAEEGDRVVAGQLLARLDDRQAQSMLTEAEARAAYALDDLARTRTLVTRDFAARATLDRAERDARAARATADAAKQRLDDYLVRAPADGLVLRRDAEVGEMVDTPASLFWIGEPRPLRVTAEVDEEDIARIRVGQRALLRADAFPGEVMPAEVAQITPKGDTDRKAYRVRLSLPDDTKLLIGMTVEANLVLREDVSAILVPPAAVVQAPTPPGANPSPAFVWVVEDGVARRRAVKLGVQGPRATEIREGLREGEQVVLDPPASLSEGQRVRIEE